MCLPQFPLINFKGGTSQRREDVHCDDARGAVSMNWDLYAGITILQNEIWPCVSPSPWLGGSFLAILLDNPVSILSFLDLSEVGCFTIFSVIVMYIAGERMQVAPLILLLCYVYYR